MTTCLFCKKETNRPKFCSKECCKSHWYINNSNSAHYYTLNDNFWETETGKGLRWEKFAADFLGADHSLFAGSAADLIWNGKKVDVKSCNLSKRTKRRGNSIKGMQSGWWVFNRGKEKEMDFFFCIALIADKPFRIYLIPAVNFPKSGTTIGWKSRYNKFILKQYQL